MKTALIVSGGGFQGLGLLEALQSLPHVRPFVADIHDDNVTRYQCADYVVIPPVSAEAAFASAVHQILEEHAVCAVFPATAHELRMLARMRRGIEDRGAQVAVSPLDLVETLLDKARTASFLRDFELPTQAPVDPVRHDYSAPLFGKPRFGWGGTGTAIASTAEWAGMHARMHGADSMVWVPLVAGFDEYSVDFAISPGGHLSPLVIRRRIRTSGGFAVISETVEIEKLTTLGQRVAAAIAQAGGRGIFNVQLIQPNLGQLFVSDVNPRFGTSAVHGLAEGINLAGFFIEDARAPAGFVRTSVKTVRRLQTIALPRLSSKPAAIVFDLDDTLVDHKLWMAAKVRGAASAVNDWVNEREFLLAALQLVDEGERAHLIDRLVSHFSWTPAQHAIVLEAYRSTAVPSTPLYPDVAPVLSSLHDAGVKLAILTDNPPQTQQTKINNAEALRGVSSVIFSRQTGGEKPHAAAFRAVASNLSLRPEQLCMVGDNYFRDAIGAIRSGYGHAFLIQRGGAFSTHHQGIASLAQVGEERGRIHPIESLVSLREILLAP